MKERRITVSPKDARRADDASLAPRPTSARVAIASDHTGIALRKALVAFLRGRGLAVKIWAPTRPSRSTIPISPASVARPVARGEADAGIVIDGAGIGSAIAANKIHGIRAVMATDRDDRALFAGAQRRERADPRRDRCSAPDEAQAIVTDLAGDADARAALHSPAREDRATWSAKPK